MVVLAKETGNVSHRVGAYILGFAGGWILHMSMYSGA